MADIQDLLQEISLLSSTSATLGWDQETYAPAQSVAHRAKQLAYLHGKFTSSKPPGIPRRTRQP